MNPYLEEPTVWHSVHEQFSTYCVEMLSPQVRPKYFVKLDINVYLHELPDSPRLAGRPGVTIGPAVATRSARQRGHARMRNRTANSVPQLMC